MKIIIITLLTLFVSIGTALSADVNLSWNQAEGATGYKLQISTDGGITWTEVTGFSVTLFTEGNLNLAKTTITVPDDVLVLGRVASFNSVATSWRYESGFFVNSAWKIPERPTGGGVQ